MGVEEPLYWEDIALGRSWQFGEYPVTRDEIIEFARHYDPMPMHVDLGLAEKTPLGQLCASGVHTFAMTQRLLCDNLLLQARVVAGGRIHSLVFRRPVVPGDRLSAYVTVTGKRPHDRRPAMGWLDFAVKTMRTDSETVLEYECRILFERHS